MFVCQISVWQIIPTHVFTQRRGINIFIQGWGTSIFTQRLGIKIFIQEGSWLWGNIIIILVSTRIILVNTYCSNQIFTIFLTKEINIISNKNKLGQSCAKLRANFDYFHKCFVIVSFVWVVTSLGLGPKKFWVQNILVQKTFWFQFFFVQWNFWSKKFFGSEIIFVSKTF